MICQNQFETHTEVAAAIQGQVLAGNTVHFSLTPSTPLAPSTTWPEDEALSAVLAARLRAKAWQAAGFRQKSQKLRDKNETKISLCEGNSACVTFTGNGKGELMCWNSIPPSSHQEGPAFHCQTGIMGIIWSLFSTRCLRGQDFLCAPAVNKARNREGNLQSSKSPS